MKKLLSLLLTLTFSLSYSQQFPHSYYNATFDGGPLTGGTLYNQNGIRLSCEIVKSVNPSGEAKKTCEYSNMESYGCEDGKYNNQTLQWYRIKFKLENLNLNKKVFFKSSQTISIEIEESETAASCCKDKYNNQAHALVLKMGPNSSIEFDSQSDGFGGWFINRPKITNWQLCSYELKNDAIINQQTPKTNSTKNINTQDSNANSGFSDGFQSGLNKFANQNQNSKTKSTLSHRELNKSNETNKKCAIGTWVDSKRTACHGNFSNPLSIIIKEDGSFLVKTKCYFCNSHESEEITKKGTWSITGNKIQFSDAHTTPESATSFNKTWCSDPIIFKEGTLKNNGKVLTISNIDYLGGSPCSLSTQNESSNDSKKTETFNPNKGKLLNSDIQSFIGQLAAETDNPDIKKLSKDLNNINQGFKETFEFDAMWGKADASDLEAYNQVESVAQAIALGVFIYNLTQKNEVQYTPEQEAAREALRNMLRNVNTIYQEVKYVPHFYEYNEEALKRLEKKEEMFKMYERATAVERALYFRYLFSSPAFTLNELKSLYAELKNKSPEDLIEMSAYYQAKKKDLSNMKHMTNNDYAFKDEIFKIQYNKAKCYDAMGQTAKANAIRANMNYEEANASTVVKGLKDGVFLNNNNLAIHSYEVLKRHMENKGVWNKYSEFESFTNQGTQGLVLSDALYLLSLGVVAYTRDKQYAQAQTEIDFISNFNRITYEWYLREKDKRVRKFEQISHDRFVNDLLNAYDKGTVYEKAVRAYLYSATKKDDGGLKLINEAINYQPRGGNVFNTFLGLNTKSNLDYIKFKVLANNNKYDEAVEASRLVREGCLIASKDQIRFEKVTLNIKRKRYDLAKTGLEILMSKQGEKPKYLYTYSSVLKELGQIEESKKYYKKYENALQID